MPDEWFTIPVETTDEGVRRPMYINSISGISGYAGNYYTNQSGKFVWSGRVYGLQTALDNLSNKPAVNQNDVIQKLLSTENVDTDDPNRSFRIE